jgi:hypothetical protein
MLGDLFESTTFVGLVCTNGGFDNEVLVLFGYIAGPAMEASPCM